MAYQTWSIEYGGKTNQYHKPFRVAFSFRLLVGDIALLGNKRTAISRPRGRTMRNKPAQNMHASRKQSMISLHCSYSSYYMSRYKFIGGCFKPSTCFVKRACNHFESRDFGAIYFSIIFHGYL